MDSNAYSVCLERQSIVYLALLRHISYAELFSVVLSLSLVAVTIRKMITNKIIPLFTFLSSSGLNSFTVYGESCFLRVSVINFTRDLIIWMSVLSPLCILISHRDDKNDRVVVDAQGRILQHPPCCSAVSSQAAKPKGVGRKLICFRKINLSQRHKGQDRQVVEDDVVP